MHPSREANLKNTKNRVVVVPDASKDLADVFNEWDGCTKCVLGEQREAKGGIVACGIGRPRGIFFLGESPGPYEEKSGEPYSDRRSGRLFRKCLDHYKIKFAYITYLTACRSCIPVLDTQGLPKKYPDKPGRPGDFIFSRQQPTVAQIEACAPRVYEELYIADPTIIVAMGQAAASFLAGASVNIKAIRGTPMEIEIPGRGNKPHLNKKGEWSRIYLTKRCLPIVQNRARYIMVPTYDPVIVDEHRHDPTKDNIFLEFVRDLFLAKMIYDRYHEVGTGVVPEQYELDVPENILEELAKEDEADYGQ